MIPEKKLAILYIVRAIVYTIIGFIVMFMYINPASSQVLNSNKNNVVANNTVQSINVKLAGAKGDGLSDDTTTIQEAINSMNQKGGGDVFLPKGTYIISTPLMIKDHINLKGESKNTIIKEKSNNHILRFVSDASDIVIADLTLDGNGASYGYGILANRNNKRVKIENCIIKSLAGSSGISFSGIGTEDIVINNNIISGIGNDQLSNPGATGHGIYILEGIKDVLIENNKISYTYGYGGIFVGGASNNIKILNNEIFNTKYRGIEVYGRNNNDIEVSGNDIYNTGEINNTRSSIGCNGILFGTLNSDVPVGTYKIFNNRLKNIGENGIEAWYGAIIQNNFIENTGYKDDLIGTSKEGIYIAVNCIVKNNIIENAGTKGIEVNAIGSSIAIKQNDLIEGNTISNVGVKINSWPSAIRIVADGAMAQVKDISILDNVMSDNQTRPTTQIAIEIFTAHGGSLADIKVSGNHIGSNIKKPYQLPDYIKVV